MCKQDEDELRGTGRTTNIVLALVRKALDNPGQEIEARDHWANAYSHYGVARAAGKVLDTLFVDNVVSPMRPDGRAWVMVKPRGIRD